ncbi:MAG: SMC-Scp complex subunit ScpB [Clostridia bacterium]|nr:SMC-Scp complex subunit ScpB [Clostridia bacterium]MBQ8399099.1 SMC-Scp complex subunit ScpB [Clostridia bacterium]
MSETNLQQQTIELLNDDEQKAALEAVLFAAGYPLSFEKLGETFGKSEKEMRYLAEELASEYNRADRGILLLVMEESCQLCSKEQYKDYIRTAMGIRSSGKLSNSCLEVLAIVAYSQPVTKAYIEQVRGVDCSWAIGTLCDKQLIEAKGRLDAPGKPILYGTTMEFLRVFGIGSLEELPNCDSPLAVRQDPVEQTTIISEESKEEALTK